ncbi:hypothetical protein LV779_19280 [Streptomyces thinghirensis]|nr:hypothetical protein [Streptomyces thinghirensis]
MLLRTARALAGPRGTTPPPSRRWPGWPGWTRDTVARRAAVDDRRRSARRRPLPPPFGGPARRPGRHRRPQGARS